MPLGLGLGLNLGAGDPGAVDLAFWQNFDLAYGSTIAQAARRGPVLDFTRASSGGVVNASGNFELAGTNEPRFDHDPVTFARRGLLIEEARTNSALYNQDLTNGVWVKSNITAAKDAFGLDGVSSSASTLTATGANGTCLQAITLASAAAVFQPYIKRKTGTGTVEITIDSGTTWVDVTGSINSSTFTRVTTTQTLANPQVGFRLGTNGDEIIVDMADCQNGAFTTSPIPTTSAATTRAADVCSTMDVGWLTQGTGTLVAEATSNNVTTDQECVLSLFEVTNQRTRIGRRLGGGADDEVVGYVTNSGDQAWLRQAGIAVAGVPYRGALAYQTNDFAFSVNGGAVLTDGAGTPPTGVTAFYVGENGDGGQYFNGHVLEIKYWNVRKSNAFLQAVST
jgi:hypothetical protein